MKKLIIAATVVAMGLVASAATINWKASSDWVSDDGENALEVMAYVFDNNANSLSSITTALSAGNTAVLGNAKGSGVVDEDGAFSFTGTTLESVSGTPYNTASMYAIILDSTSAGSAKWYYATGVETVELTDAVLAAEAKFYFDDYLGEVGDVGTGDWKAINVPEPTSGLLLLLGMGALALRRRRA